MLLAVVLHLGGASVRAQEIGVSEKRVLFGQSAALTGSGKEVGSGIRLGIEAAFAAVNRRGGIEGRRLELVSLDDGYEPELAVVNSRSLINDTGVFGIIGTVGTPAARSVVPIVEEQGVPFIAPVEGGDSTRDPRLTTVVNLRASHEQEARTIVSGLVRDLNIQRVGILYQDDSFGRAGLVAAQQELNRFGLELAARGSFARNTTAVKRAVLDLRSGNPEAVVVFGTSEPVARAILWSRRIGFSPIFVTNSFSGDRGLVHELGGQASGVYTAQVVPDPLGTSRVASAYRAALKARDAGARPSFVSMEGYLAGRLAIVGLERCGELVTRQRFLYGLLQGGRISLDGFNLAFGERDNQGSDFVLLTRIGTDGRLMPVSGFSRVAGP